MYVWVKTIGSLGDYGGLAGVQDERPLLIVGVCRYMYLLSVGSNDLASFNSRSSLER